METARPSLMLLQLRKDPKVVNPLFNFFYFVKVAHVFYNTVWIACQDGRQKNRTIGSRGRTL